MMNSIKGLILKDLLSLKSYVKTIIVFFVIFLFVGLYGNSVDFVLPLIMIVIFGMCVLATFGYDEISNSDKFYLTLPVTRKQIIISKYILAFSSLFIGAITGILITLILMITKSEFKLIEILSASIGGMFGIGIVQCIQIPCMYKFGAEKGRIFLFAIMAAIGGIFGVLYMILKNINLNIQLDKVTTFFESYGLIILIILTLISYFISYMISNKIFSKKEL